MARYVVVEFDDNADAEAFIQQLDADNEARRKARESFPRRVVGVFVKPGKTCECPDGRKSNYGDKNYRWATVLRGDKFGWWVCTACKRPRAAGHSLVNQILPSQTYEGVTFNKYEFGVTNLSVSGFHTNNIDRPKRLRRKKVKG